MDAPYLLPSDSSLLVAFQISDGSY
ncbi:unnamed protein product [Podospora anserina S mat+]|uniref:Podospora anserina S mat+ genomic DNA chromosome 7, supercontig 1 n=1 Tax=Podospora anserina (strain S / ATCC MYA-4624 / DSM 980 / FGSC 10383) TaxID=515849 RepID=B2AVK6_PODAN|nr:unnamed protein product [Podospora anserina S mat+]CDP31903.1 Putative protein of unknown function [Podospora anserina S mat+]